MKNHNHLNISQKFWQNPIHNPSKIFQQTTNRRELSQPEEGHSEKSCYHQTQWCKTGSFPPKIRTKAKMSMITTYIHHCTCSSGKEKKKNTGIQMWNKEVQLSLFTDDMIIYVENSVRPIKMLLKLKSGVSKVTGHKVNMQKSVW